MKPPITLPSKTEIKELYNIPNDDFEVEFSLVDPTVNPPVGTATIAEAVAAWKGLKAFVLRGPIGLIVTVLFVGPAVVKTGMESVGDWVNACAPFRRMSSPTDILKHVNNEAILGTTGSSSVVHSITLASDSLGYSGSLQQSGTVNMIEL